MFARIELSDSLDSCSEREFGWNTGVEILQYKYSIDSKISVISVSRLYK